MPKLRILSLLVGLGCLATAQAQQPQELKTLKDKTSYAIGVQTARNFKKDGIDVDIDLMLRGLKDGLSGERLLMPDKEIKQLMQTVLVDLRQKMAANRRDAAERNRKRGEEFLAANRIREGIQELPNGVQYRVITAGSGPKPGDADTVFCHYRGTLLDGTEFDATPPERQAALRVAQAIPGWREALKAMPVGSRWQIFIPPSLAYGERGVGTDIGPNEVLTFDVELLGIDAPEKSATAQ